jgi:hypothetical protein
MFGTSRDSQPSNLTYFDRSVGGRLRPWSDFSGKQEVRNESDGCSEDGQNDYPGNRDPENCPLAIGQTDAGFRPVGATKFAPREQPKPPLPLFHARGKNRWKPARR